MSEFKEHVNSSVDFYAILNLEFGADDAAINRAYRQQSKLYHPDKVGPDDTVAAEKLQQVQIARGVLSDGPLRELYDNSRKAREQKKAQQAAMSDKRREMIEKLEKAELAGSKRKREESDEARQKRQKEEDIKARNREVVEAFKERRRKEAEAAERVLERTLDDKRPFETVDYAAPTKVDVKPAERPPPGDGAKKTVPKFSSFPKFKT